jgi:hypothetical protein
VIYYLQYNYFLSFLFDVRILITRVVFRCFIQFLLAFSSYFLMSLLFWYPKYILMLHYINIATMEDSVD